MRHEYAETPACALWQNISTSAQPGHTIRGFCHQRLIPRIETTVLSAVSLGLHQGA